MKKRKAHIPVQLHHLSAGAQTQQGPVHLSSVQGFTVVMHLQHQPLVAVTSTVTSYAFAALLKEVTADNAIAIAI